MDRIDQLMYKLLKIDSIMFNRMDILDVIIDSLVADSLVSGIEYNE